MALCCLLLCLNLTLIWGNSLLDGPASSKISQWAVDQITTAIPGVQPTPQEPVQSPGQSQGQMSGQSQGQTQKPAQNEQTDQEFHFAVRKVGHLLEFFSLGVLLSWLIRMLCKKKWQYFALPLLFGIAVAAVDEFIQIFIPERDGRIMDVGIDTLGIVLGIVLITSIIFIKNKTIGGKKI